MKLIVLLIMLWVLCKYDKPTKGGGNPNYQRYAMKNDLMRMFK